MQVIVLAGLVTIEKARLAADIAGYLINSGRTVRVLDQMTRLPLQPQLHVDAPVQRLQADDLDHLPQLLATIDEDTVVIAASEQVHPDTLFMALDELALAQPEITITTLALIDLRTCDCFPHVREALEHIADHTIQLPYALEDILHDAGIA